MGRPTKRERTPDEKRDSKFLAWSAVPILIAYAVAFKLSDAAWWVGVANDHWAYASHSFAMRLFLAQGLFCGLYGPICGLVLDRFVDSRLRATALFLSGGLVGVGLGAEIQAIEGLVSLSVNSDSTEVPIMDPTGVLVYALIGIANLLVGVPLARRTKRIYAERKKLRGPTLREALSEAADEYPGLVKPTRWFAHPWKALYSFTGLFVGTVGAVAGLGDLSSSPRSFPIAVDVLLFVAGATWSLTGGIFGLRWFPKDQKTKEPKDSVDETDGALRQIERR